MILRLGSPHETIWMLICRRISSREQGCADLAVHPGHEHPERRRWWRRGGGRRAMRLASDDPVRDVQYVLPVRDVLYSTCGTYGQYRTYWMYRAYEPYVPSVPSRATETARVVVACAIG